MKEWKKCVVRYPDGDELDYYDEVSMDFLSEYEFVAVSNPFPDRRVSDKDWEDAGFLVLHI